jgi:hypothetical protein
MAATQVCGGGRVGRTGQDGSAFFGADALWAGARWAGNGAAGADSAGPGAAVGDAGLAEWPADDGEVLWGVSGWRDSVAPVAMEFVGWHVGRLGGVWRVCAGSGDGRGLRGIVRWWIRIGADYYFGKYPGGA